MTNQVDFDDVDVPRKSINDATPEEWDEVRMDMIGQNGNDGEHYPDTMSEAVQKLCDQYKDNMLLAKQVGGDHYKKYKIQPWDIIDEYGLNYYEGNALKYLLRTKNNRVEDLQKAIHYIEKLIEVEH